MDSENLTNKIPAARSRCFMVYALAPDGLSASDANSTINAMIGDDALPLAVWHDHFLGGPGGCIVFYVENEQQQEALFSNNYLAGWKVDYRPMVFSFSPSAFDSQIGYTLQAYSNTNWEKLRRENRPDYGGRNVQAEAETAEES